MPLYDFLMLIKSRVEKDGVMNLLARVGQLVQKRNGVITDIKSFGTIQLGYGIKKLDGRHFKGKLTQMTVMVPPTFHKELQYLNQEDLVLRWLVVKHRDDAKYGLEFINEEDGKDELSMFRTGGAQHQEKGKEDKDSDEDDYEVQGQEVTTEVN